MVAREYEMVQNKEGAYETRRETPLRDERKGLVSKLKNVVRGAIAGAMLYVGAMVPRNANADLVMVANASGSSGVGSSVMYTSNQEGGSLGEDSGDSYSWERPPGSPDNWLRVYSDQNNQYYGVSGYEQSIDNRPFSGEDANQAFPLVLDTQGPNPISANGNYVQFQLQSAIDPGREYYNWTFTLTDPSATFADGSGNTRTGVWNLAESSTFSLPAYNLANVQGAYASLEFQPMGIPEPATGALVLTGLAAAAASRRRRNKSRK